MGRKVIQIYILKLPFSVRQNKCNHLLSYLLSFIQLLCKKIAAVNSSIKIDI